MDKLAQIWYQNAFYSMAIYLVWLAQFSYSHLHVKLLISFCENLFAHIWWHDFWSQQTRSHIDLQ